MTSCMVTVIESEKYVTVTSQQVIKNGLRITKSQGGMPTKSSPAPSKKEMATNPF